MPYKKWAEADLCSNSTVYDFGFYEGPYSDETLAKHYKHLLEDCDLECWSTGTRWSVVYMLLQVANILFTIQGVLLGLGVWVFPSRFAGLMCQTCCNLYFFAVLLITTIYLFNPMGKLAALSEAGSSFTMVDGVAIQSTETTYE